MDVKYVINYFIYKKLNYKCIEKHDNIYCIMEYSCCYSTIIEMINEYCWNNSINRETLHKLKKYHTYIYKLKLHDDIINYDITNIKLTHFQFFFKCIKYLKNKNDHLVALKKGRSLLWIPCSN